MGKIRGIEIISSVAYQFKEILTNDALEFVAELQRTFGRWREALLKARVTRQKRFDAGELPDFLSDPEAQKIRQGDWQVAAPPAPLRDRRVEITGPASVAKMVINALNSGANVYLADFEDSEAPTLGNLLQGQRHLYEAARGTLTYRSPDGKDYRLAEQTAVLMARPRGWHLLEKNCRVDREAVSASLFDFGLYAFHNARALIDKGSGPYFYLPKLENHLEARLWNEVFRLAEEILGLSRGAIKATVLIETLPAAFEMNEILYELAEHSAGLNCGRWDYLFSFIKTFRNRREFVLPDRAELTMDKGFLAAYAKLLVQTCHRRGAQAMGGMAAQIPIKHDPATNEAALEKVRADKECEARLGHDGTWVAHPGLVSVAREMFDRHSRGANQLSFIPEGAVTAKDLLAIPSGQSTLKGVETNVKVGLEYLSAWLCGNGCVPINHLMEDTATAEICRAQSWQWVRHRAPTVSGAEITPTLVGEKLKDELSGIERQLGPERFAASRYQLAATLLEKMVTAEEFPEFLTQFAYDYL